MKRKSRKDFIPTNYYKDFMDLNLIDGFVLILTNADNEKYFLRLSSHDMSMYIIYKRKKIMEKNEIDIEDDIYDNSFDFISIYETIITMINYLNLKITKLEIDTFFTDNLTSEGSIYIDDSIEFTLKGSEIAILSVLLDMPITIKNKALTSNDKYFPKIKQLEQENNNSITSIELSEYDEIEIKDEDVNIDINNHIDSFIKFETNMEKYIKYHINILKNNIKKYIELEEYENALWCVKEIERMKKI